MNFASMTTRMATCVEVRKKPKILLSSFDLNERKELSEKIRKLGGILYESVNYTSSATHIVCKIPSRGEKFICGCAAGKWVLCRTYIDESLAQNKWLDEDLYEWNSSMMKANVCHKALFELPRKWRLRKQSQQKGMFDGWIVLLVFEDQKKKDGYKRLIEAGGGRVFNMKPPYSSIERKRIKYIIYEKIEAKQLRPLKRAGIPFLQSESIIDYIIKDQNDSLVVLSSPKTREKQRCISSTKVNDLMHKSDSPQLFSSGISPKPRQIKLGERGTKVQNAEKKTKQTHLKSFFIQMTQHYNTEREDAKKLIDSDSLDGFCIKNNANNADKGDSMMQREPCNEGKCTKNLEKCKEANLILDEIYQPKFQGKVPAEKILNPEKETSRVSVTDSTNISKRPTGQENDQFYSLEVAKGLAHPFKENNNEIYRKAENEMIAPNIQSNCKDKIKSTQNNFDSQSAINKNKISKPDNVIDKDHLFDATVVKNSLPIELSPKSKNTSSDGNKVKVSPSKINVKKEMASRVKTENRNHTIESVDLSCLFHHTRNAKKKRKLMEENSKERNIESSKNSPKKIKMSEEFRDLKEIINDHELLMHQIRLPHLSNDQVISRQSIHRNCAGLIEGCLEEGFKRIAVKMMSIYLSSTCFLTSNFLYGLMQMLMDPPDDFDLAVISEIGSILNRSLYLHNPIELRSHYLSSLRKPRVNENGCIVESVSPFEFIMEIIDDTVNQLSHSEKKPGKNSRIEKIREFSKLTLLKYVVDLLEQDLSLFFARPNKSKKPIVAEIFWPRLDAAGQGASIRNFLTVTIDIAFNSMQRKALMPLNSLTFSILRIAAGYCEASDIKTLNARFGSACEALVSETYAAVSPIIKDNTKRHQCLRRVLSYLSPQWLTARVCDAIIGLYDISLLHGELRKNLMKPLSLEKVVSCYFHLIPKIPGSVDSKSSSSKHQSVKPLSVIGNTSSELSKRNSKATKEGKKRFAVKRNRRGIQPALYHTFQSSKSLLLLCNSKATKKGKKRFVVKRNRRGETQLHLACIKNQPSVVKELLLKGIDPNLKDNAGWTALHEACNHGSHECVNELLKCKDLNLFATAMNGISALHDAVANNQFKVVQLLLNSGGSALLDMKTEMQKTALDLASNGQMKRILESYVDSRHQSKTRRNISRKDKVECSYEDIQIYLFLLLVLLKYLSSSVMDSSLQLANKFDDLQKHILKLNDSRSVRNLPYLSLLRNYLT